MLDSWACIRFIVIVDNNFVIEDDNNEGFFLEGQVRSRRFYQDSEGSIIDTKTGEVLGHGHFVYVQQRVRITEGWFMGFQGMFSELAQNRRLWGRPRAVLDVLLANLDFENYIAIPQAEIATKLELNKANVSAAIRILLEEGVITKGPKLGRVWSYKLNPNIAWRGKAKNRTKVISLDQARKKKAQKHTY